ncbi:hypothetical protein RDI58_011222 [Solanum bulbocastanum]|uniref:Uncharacterized protein n=1 Tax=Solanum bulbocastanum TaxID=147425 RepID=A0AAN8TXN2_SOLBU
MIRLAAVFFGY